MPADLGPAATPAQRRQLLGAALVAVAISAAAAARPPGVDLVLMLVTSAVVLVLARDRGLSLAHFGLRARVQPSVGYWVKLLGVLLLVAGPGAALLVWLTPSQTIARMAISPRAFVEYWLPVVVLAYPVAEELLFRLVLMTALLSVTTVRKRNHQQRPAVRRPAGVGTPDPFNQLSGFLRPDARAVGLALAHPGDARRSATWPGRCRLVPRTSTCS